jgi:DNA repair exonuclease SbcCD ATPase subunit
MIRRLHLQGWRAFEDLAIDLDDGLTFVVAENGVGKTSLVQAAAWGLYGKLSGVDARAARRFGASETRVEVDLELPDGRTLSIERQVGERAEPMRAWVGQVRLDDEAVGRLMAEAFGAPREYLSKTTLIPSESFADDAAGAFHLRAHLCHVFGVDDLQTAADELRRLNNEADAAAKKIRQATRRAAADLAELRTLSAEAEAAWANAETAHATTRADLAAAERRLREAHQNEAARAQAAAARQAFADLLSASRQYLGRDAASEISEPAALVAGLEAAEATVADALDRHRTEAATVAGQLDAVRAAASELHAAGAQCPVCRRELSPDDLAHADRAHQQDISALSAQWREISARVKSASERLDAVRALSRNAARLPDIATVPDGSALDLRAARSAMDRAREEVERFANAAAGARARRAELAAQIAEEEQAARDTRQAYLAHRREAVTSIAAEVMRTTADTILAERIDPLALQISHRWKQVFGDRGALRLRADGRLILAQGIHEIPFAQFSSGEKVIALLAVRLLVLGASTRASFLWLDEPLEHLDPKNRRITASLMAAAGKHVRQILVTTYEESLARRLAAGGHADLRYVRSS